MTTLVYDYKNKQLACDSRETSTAGVIVTDCCNKVDITGDLVFMCCGSTCDIPTFVNQYKPRTKIVDEGTMDVSALMLRGGVCYYAFTSEGVFYEEELTMNYTLGSGSKFALAALDLGKSAKEAIEYAMTRDCYSGGKVQVLGLDGVVIE